ncbi:MAG: hypothetical protein ACD_12C00558G0004 [uncultured bacterium]|nr:MAG: hypothetical protein ACD_12C00558G0004 [uncultured bacterium]
MKMKKSFTLLELLIVIALVVIIAIAVLILFNPWTQMNKAWDSKRKTELTQLNKALEDYYNDHGCYPKPADICYDSPVNVCTGLGSHTLDSQTCHICGNESGSPSFSPYLSKFPCDPQHSQKKYLYQVAAASGVSCPISVEDATNTCPQWYRIYSDLGNQSDAAIKELGCQAGGCGVAPNYGYEYGVTSPNEKLKKTTAYYCYTPSKTCDNQSPKTYEMCEANPSCVEIYSSRENCCLHQPKPLGCP